MTNPNEPAGAGIRRTVVASAFGALALALAACGSSSASVTATTVAPATAGTAPGAGAARPGASGTIAAITGQSLEVQNPRTGQTTVTYTVATVFRQTVAGSLAQVSVGSCITAFGTPPATGATGSTTSTPPFGAPVTATRVTVAPPTNGSCTRTGPGGAPRTGTGGAPGAPGTGGFRRRAGTTPRFSAVFGQVTAVAGALITVTATDPATGATAALAVTTTSSTSFTVEEAAAPSDLAVGKCAQAFGTADTTGAITARSISISSPGPNGCTGGFGGGTGGFGGGGTGSTGAASA